VILIGCGVPKRGMGWYHAKQLLDGDVPSAHLTTVVEPWFLGQGADSPPGKVRHALSLKHHMRLIRRAEGVVTAALPPDEALTRIFSGAAHAVSRCLLHGLTTWRSSTVPSLQAHSATSKSRCVPFWLSCE
jgi:hypothetical protein